MQNAELRVCDAIINDRIKQFVAKLTFFEKKGDRSSCCFSFHHLFSCVWFALFLYKVLWNGGKLMLKCTLVQGREFSLLIHFNSCPYAEAYSDINSPPSQAMVPLLFKGGKEKNNYIRSFFRFKIIFK